MVLRPVDASRPEMGSSRVRVRVRARDRVRDRTCGRVEAGGGFVEEEQRRVGH